MVQCVSIFSGAGGLDVGALAAGAQIIACVEHDSDAAETLRINHGHLKADVIEKDIQDVDFEQWKGITDSILIGGPPCQPFSKNGYWIRNDNRLIQDDPRNLLGQFLRALAEMRPKGFLFENVESILHPTNKDEFFRFVANAETLGYRCTSFKTNAADFGVPQKRKRVFVFGVLSAKTAIPSPNATHSDHSSKNSDSSLPDYLGVGPFIEKYDTLRYSEPQEDASRGTYFHELTHVPPGKNYIALTKTPNYAGRIFRPGGRFWNFLYKLHPDLPSITIAAQPGPWVGPFHWTDRRLRVPEIAAIQTFPENYKFAGNRRSIQKQIGNAVPCLLAEKMVKHLMEHAI
ncbi:MAG TPA: DNA cytosine methyltransferase [Rhodospirillaceae bacterium]|nr:DNA (cytosine-5-)-methyltransferase [Magnetovibrio sp.]HBT40815.1 DNA cytosine methyltransferase [Rhodospirillaceae bacterium]|tara:strand:- start:2403 stop:3437 length:1035 start_codon:yes stop_codon:yes gene_type:complete